MSANVNSSDSITEDMIRSFIQLACSELHYKTLIEKRVSEIENELIDDKDVPAQMKEIDDLKMRLEQVADLRRKEMLYVYNKYGAKGNKEMWCTVKHLGMAMYSTFEVYQACDTETPEQKSEKQELLNYALWANEEFNIALTKFLGVTVTPCASCLGDILKAELGKSKDD